MKYVAGFLFTTDKSQVWLIEKTKPAWQAGKLNGIGGKVKPSEEPLDAMIREFQEEAGLLIKDWEPTILLSGLGWEVQFFRAFSDEVLRSQEEERVSIHYITKIPKLNTINNLKWLIPIQLDFDLKFPFSIKEITDMDNIPQK